MLIGVDICRGFDEAGEPVYVFALVNVRRIVEVRQGDGDGGSGCHVVYDRGSGCEVLRVRESLPDVLSRARDAMRG